MLASHSEGSLKTHLWHLSEATFPISLSNQHKKQRQHQDTTEHWDLQQEKERKPKKIRKGKLPSQHYLPFSIVVELNGHLAEGLPDKILTVHLLQTLCSCLWTAKPIFPHQHPATQRKQKERKKKPISLLIFTDTHHQEVVFGCSFYDPFLCFPKPNILTSCRYRPQFCNHFLLWTSYNQSEEANKYKKM